MEPDNFAGKNNEQIAKSNPESGSNLYFRNMSLTTSKKFLMKDDLEKKSNAGSKCIITMAKNPNEYNFKRKELNGVKNMNEQHSPAFDLQIGKILEIEELNREKSTEDTMKARAARIFKSLQNSPKNLSDSTHKKANKRKFILKGRFKSSKKEKIGKANQLSKWRFKRNFCKFSTVNKWVKAGRPRMHMQTIEPDSPAAPIQDKKTEVWQSPKSKGTDWQQDFCQSKKYERDRNTRKMEFTANVVRYPRKRPNEQNVQNLMRKSNFDSGESFFRCFKNFSQPKRKVSFSKFKQKFSLTRRIPSTDFEDCSDFEDSEKKHFDLMKKKQSELKHFFKECFVRFKRAN